jgi:hypothetical protein
MTELVPAEHYEEDPEGGWKGSDLTEEELSDEEYASQFKTVQVKGEADGLGESNQS